MTWAKLDDHFPFHRKIRPISDAAFRLHVSAICWCCEHLTDGHVEHDEVALCSDVKKYGPALGELVRRGLWHQTDTGWVIHDFLTYNEPRAKVLAARDKEAQRKREWRERREALTSVPTSVPLGHDAGQESPVDRLSEHPGPARPVLESQRPSAAAPRALSVAKEPTGTQAIVAAYLEGAESADLPRPAQSLAARVGKQAKAMLATNDHDTLVAAARTCGANGWPDLALQVQRDAVARKQQARGPMDYVEVVPRQW